MPFSAELLPAEVLEAIFLNLDGKSFCQILTVCKSWYTVLKRMQVNKKLWLTFCTKEIPTGVIEELLSYKSVPLKNFSIEWKSLYKKWSQGRLIKNKEIRVDYIQSSITNPIHCMNVSDSWVITGHSDGTLRMWSQVNGNAIQECRCHLRPISDMALVDLQNLGSYYGSETRPFAHHHIITISEDTTIKVKCILQPIADTESDIILNKHGNALSSVRVFEDQFAVSDRGNTVTLWKMLLHKKPRLHLEVSLLRTITGPSDFLVAIGLWYGKLCCTTHPGRLQVYEPEKNKWLEQTYFYKCLGNAGEEMLAITRCFIFRNGVIFMCTASGKLLVSIDEDNYTCYELMFIFQSLVLSVLLKGNILALGGENGRLYLYSVPDTKSLLNLDLSRPTFVYSLNEASLLRLDIQYDCDTPKVYASTTERIFIIKWLGGRVKIGRQHHEVSRIDYM